MARVAPAQALTAGSKVAIVAGDRHVGELGEIVRFDRASVESGQYGFEVKLKGGATWHFTAAQLAPPGAVPRRASAPAVIGRRGPVRKPLRTLPTQVPAAVQTIVYAAVDLHEPRDRIQPDVSLPLPPQPELPQLAWLPRNRKRQRKATMHPLKPSTAPPRAAWPETPSKPSSVDVGYAVTVIAGPRYVGRQGKVVRFDGASVESLQYAYEVQLDGGELWHFTAAQLRRTPRLPEPPPAPVRPRPTPQPPPPEPEPEIEVVVEPERPAPHGRMAPPDAP